MDPTIVLMDINAPKFTLTPTRFEIKMPTKFDAAYAGRVVAFAKTVAARIGAPTQSLRGTVKTGSDPLFVQMKKNNHEAVGFFTEGETVSSSVAVSAGNG